MKRKIGWYCCTFEPGDELIVSDEIIVRCSLKAGSVLSEKEFSEVRTISQRAAAKDQALRALSFRSRSEKELKQKLYQKGIAPAVSGEVVDDLKRLKFVDDEDFANRFVNDLIKRKPAGELLLRSELFNKGISEKIINKVLDRLFSEIGQADLARKSADKWIATHPRVKKEQIRQKLSQFLYQRGFTWTIIEQVLGDHSAF
ncbi:MAG: hypothetical protein GY863_13645 [bacterium]|nr:hypothetical protein [bacterium]